MKQINFFRFLMVLIAVIFLAGCQKDELDLLGGDGLYLKLAKVGEKPAEAIYLSSENGQGGTFQYPNHLVFEISAENAHLLNKLMFDVQDFHVFDDGRAIFRVAELGTKPAVIGEFQGKQIVSPNGENVEAAKIPFNISDFGKQGSGQARFNGLLVAANYVLAIDLNHSRLVIYDVNQAQKLSVKNLQVNQDLLNFKVGNADWSLKFIQSSPAGNVFELTAGGQKYACYTLIF